MSHPILDAALDYARKGIPIFPCIPGTKLPLLAGSFHNATVDEAVIRSWFPLGRRAPNIAFEPASAKLTVVDVDDKNGHRGSASWAAVCTEDGIDVDTLVIGTPSGGSHFYFKDEKGLPPSASDLGDGLDIRSRGGYVLLPPSALDEYDGRQYTIKRNALVIKPIGPTIALRLAVKDTAAQESIVRAEDLDSDANVGRARAKLEQHVAAANVSVQGAGGNHKAYLVATQILAIGLSPEKCLELMAEIWNPHCQPPWNETGGDRRNPSLDIIIANAREYMTNEPGATGLVPGSQLWPPEHLEACRSEATMRARNDARSRWRPMRPSEAIAMPPPEWWDKHKLFPKGRSGATGMVFGPPARHKSGVVLASLFDLWKKYGDDFRVVMAIGEDRDIIGQRLRANMLSVGMTADELDRRLLLCAIPYVMIQDETVNIAEWLVKYEGFRPDVFVIDTFATALQGADEDTRAGAVLTERGNLGVLARELRTFPLVVHHTGHEGRKARGSSSFEGNVSVYASVGIAQDGKGEPENPDAVSLHVIKTKGARGGHRAFYEIKDIGGVPVPQATTRGVYDVLIGSEQFNEGKIRLALLKLNALSQERGVSSFNLLRTMHPRPEESEPERWDSLLAGLSRKLESRAGEGVLRGFNNKQFNANPVAWYTAAS